jgi:hypothetical protein
MRHRCARLAGIVICATALAASAAEGETLTYTTPGTTEVTLPTGVAIVHVVAVGGRGGGALGGFGAVVSGDVSIVSPDFPETSPRLLIEVAGNGGIGVGGVNHGGEAGAPGLPILAGGGGGSSALFSLTQINGAPAYLAKIEAGGGGGAGAPSLFDAGGAGGSAGAAGSAGTSTPNLTAAGGGEAGARRGSGGGIGSNSSDIECEGGEAGEDGALSDGGAGGLSADASGHGDGGGGGGGRRGGGGGGGGAFCSDDSGTSGGGGGGGSSAVPIGGSLAIDTTGQPYVQITYELEEPTVTITAPAIGTTYEQSRSIQASYACAPPAALPQDRIASCTGTTASGAPIDTRRLGYHVFSVTATDVYGLTTTQTINYLVADLTRPQIRRLRIEPRTIGTTDAHDYAMVRFRLSEPARVRVAVERVGASKGHAARAHARIVSGKRGTNSFRLQARIGRRTLRPSAYRLTLVATDPSGNRSKPVERRFTIAG